MDHGRPSKKKLILSDRIMSQPTIGMNSLLQMQMLSKMQTGNPIMDGIVYSLITLILPGCLSWIVVKAKHIVNIVCFYWAARFWNYLWRRMQNKHRYFGKSVNISYITDGKNINELYKAVDWYLSNSNEIDFIRETPLTMSYEKKIDATKEIDFEIDTLNKHVVNDITKKIPYNGHMIHYRRSKELIEVYTDKKREKQNYIINLYIEMDRNIDVDVFEEFSRFCILEYKKSLSATTWKQMIYTHQDSKWKSSLSNNRRDINNIVLQNGLSHEIKDDMELFIDSEDWYYERGIPWKRGYLFYGPPGNGKTSMIAALSLMAKRHMHYLNLSNVKTDAALMTLLNDIDYSKTVLVIEDIDCMSDIVKERQAPSEPVTQQEPSLNQVLHTLAQGQKSSAQAETRGQTPSQSGLTLSGLLNALDGIFSATGRIMIMTSNHPDILDTALIRTGRIDMKYHLQNATRTQVGDLYKVFFGLDASTSIDTKLMSQIENYKYSVSDITGTFIQHRNDPRKALAALATLD